MILNGVAPDDDQYRPMWTDLAWMQARGTRVMLKLGGRGADATVQLLQHDFDGFFAVLEETIRRHGLDGVDLDLGPAAPVALVERLVSALRLSFGPGLAVSVSVASPGFDPGSGYGFNATDLFTRVGAAVDWWTMRVAAGDLGGGLAQLYRTRLRQSGIPAPRLVVDVSTSDKPALAYADAPAEIAQDDLRRELQRMRQEFPGLGGVAGTDYALAMWNEFIYQSVGEMPSWGWFRDMHAALHPMTAPLAPQRPSRMEDSAAAQRFTEAARAFLRASVGRVEAHYPDGYWTTGTGVVVASPSGDLMATAAHNVWDQDHGGRPEVVLFIPGYDRGQMPYDAWVAYAWDVPPAFLNGFPLDVAVVMLRPQDGVHVEQRVGGGHQIRFDRSEVAGQEFIALGYPERDRPPAVDLHDRGERLWIGESRTELPARLSRDSIYALQPVTPLLLNYGFSGGPWLADVDLETGRGTIISLTKGSRPKTGDWHTSGAYFGPAASELFRKYHNVSEPPFVVEVTNRGRWFDASATVSTPDGQERGQVVVPPGRSATMRVPVDGWRPVTVTAANGYGRPRSLEVPTRGQERVSLEFAGTSWFGFEFRVVSTDGVPVGDQSGPGYAVWTTAGGATLVGLAGVALVARMQARRRPATTPVADRPVTGSPLADPLVTGSPVADPPVAGSPPAGSPALAPSPDPAEAAVAGPRVEFMPDQPAVPTLIVSVDEQGVPLLATGQPLRFDDVVALLDGSGAHPAVRIITASPLSVEAAATFERETRTLSDALADAGHLTPGARLAPSDPTESSPAADIGAPSTVEIELGGSAAGCGCSSGVVVGMCGWGWSRTRR